MVPTLLLTFESVFLKLLIKSFLPQAQYSLATWLGLSSARAPSP